MKLGIDVSSYFEGLAHGVKYFDGECEVDPLDKFRINGVEYMRIRVWVNPYTLDGKPYLGGTCDLNNFIRLAHLAEKKGYKILLDIHYSDFWVDPAKQTVPKAWQGRSFNQMTRTVYEYTLSLLRSINAEGISLAFVQVGNEITNGFLWDFGKLTYREGAPRAGYENFTALLKQGVSACREVYPEASVILHLERSYDQEIYSEFFDNMLAFGVDFDVIGFSYYPSWHGTFEQFFANVDMCKRYNKRLVVVECGYPFTLEDYLENPHGGTQPIVTAEGLLGNPMLSRYPYSPEGQAKYTEDFLSLCEEHKIESVFWWEPLWVPKEGICWASVEGEEYIGEEGKPTRNDWANLCLYDYFGKKLPAFDKFKTKK